MKVVLTDYDGIIVSTEFAKNLSYWIAVRHLKGDRGISVDDMEAIHRGDAEGMALTRRIAEADRREVEMIDKRFAGGTREQFTERVWKH